MLAEVATMIAAGSVLMIQKQKEAVMQRGGWQDCSVAELVP